MAEKLRLSIIKKKADEQKEQKPKEDILASGITELNDRSTLETYVSRCLDIVKQHPDVKDAEVFAATHHINRTHIAYNSALPSQAVEPMTTEGSGIVIDIVFNDGRRGTVGTRSLFTVDAVNSLVKLARKDSVYDPHFVGLPVSIEGEAAPKFAGADEQVMKMDNAAVTELAHEVVRGALGVYAQAIADGTLKLDEETLDLGYGVEPISEKRTNITIHGHASSINEKWAVKSTTGITASDEATKLSASVMSGVELASPDIEWGFKKESKARSSAAATHLKDFNPAEVGADAARKVLALEASDERVVLPSGKYKAILSPQATAQMFIYVGEHAMNLQMAVEFGDTIFTPDDIGKQVISKKLSIYDDPTLPGSISSRNLTHEGTPAKKTMLVDHGVFVDYIKDTYYTNKYKGLLEAVGLDTKPRNGLRMDQGVSSSSGHARPTYTNLVVEGHDTVPLEKMFSDIAEGEKVVYFDQLWYSYPMHKERKGSNHQWGSMTSSSPAGSYLVEKRNGKIVKTPLAPNKDRLLFNVRDVLSNVEQVSSETERINDWAADSTIVAPYMKAKDIELVEVGKYVGVKK